MTCYLCGSSKFVSHCERCHRVTCASHAFDPRDQYDREAWVCGPCVNPLPAQHPVLRSITEYQLERSIEIVRQRKAR